MRTSRRFPCRRESVTAARRFVREALRGQAAEVVDAVELMTSELTSNSVRHAETGFELVLSVRDELRVDVRDSGGGKPRLLSPPLQQTSGRGLRIVDAMSSDWGVETTPAGKTVWFTLPLPTADGRGSTPASASAHEARGKRSISTRGAREGNGDGRAGNRGHRAQRSRRARTTA